MRFAIFSDIHANLEALETAAASAQYRTADSTVVLGDTLGYGANPNECFEWALQHASVHLMGNHEWGVVEPAFRDWFNPEAREGIVWTDRALDEKFKKEILGLVYLKVDHDMTFAHGSVAEPEKFHYLTSFRGAVPSFRAMETQVAFVGHTHVPSCFCERAGAAFYLLPGVARLEEGERYILNPGSLGQPRDRDPRLAFGLFDDRERTFEVVRLPYDNQKAAEKILKAGLPRFFADRLL